MDNNKVGKLNAIIHEKSTAISTQLDTVKEITIPQAYFSGASHSYALNIYFISDIHIETHMKSSGIDTSNVKLVIAYIDKIVKKLITPDIAEIILKRGVSGNKLSQLIFDDYSHVRYLYRHLNKDEFNELEEKISYGTFDEEVAPTLSHCVVFGGDISSSIQLTKLFFERLMLRLKYHMYKNWKAEHGRITIEIEGLSVIEATAKYEKNYQDAVNMSNIASNTLKQLETTTGKSIYKTYANKDSDDAERLIKARKDIPDYAYNLLENVKSKNSRVKYLKENRDNIIKEYIEGIHNKIDKDIKELCPIFYILGNHECSEFELVKDAVETYTSELNKYGVSVLQNDVIEFGNCVVCGGIGFAQYNDQFNANNIICAKQMQGNRQYELNEGNLFEEKYYYALQKATDISKPLIVFTHHPVRDWLGGKTNGRCYYFNGHTHRNIIQVSENGVIYADNQVGYSGDDYYLKRYPIGTIYNPFIDYEDGYHKLDNPQVYADFYMYNGESIGLGKIKAALDSNNDFYMIKRNGFYGFFLINNKRTLICAGGNTKKISDIHDIEYFDNCFNLMIYQYVMALKPFRKFQEHISAEIKSLDLPTNSAGNIHGCIIDVDFFHHIMINPSGKGQITFYYSPVYGFMQRYESFEKLLESIEEKNYRLYAHNKGYIENKKQFFNDNARLLPMLTNESLIGDYNKDIVMVDTSDPMYKASRNMNQLQRLFTANILRDWDNGLIEKIIEIDDVEEYVSDKTLTNYQLVQKHWKNLLRVEPDQITEKMVKCAVSWERRCRFPYMDTEKKYGDYYGINPIEPEAIKEYILHIPKTILRETVFDFSAVLRKDLLKYYPLDCIRDEDLCSLLSYLSGREIVALLDSIKSDWPTSFGEQVAKVMNQKNKPVYCSKELWQKIRKYDQA
ncbi:MAG: hypothetical protein E7273_10815 [Pseudobutyrivibrio ruminis]|nr:hypothetical protein [Pseudobutyrivibrio ruminis]